MTNFLYIIFGCLIGYVIRRLQHPITQSHPLIKFLTSAERRIADFGTLVEKHAGDDFVSSRLLLTEKIQLRRDAVILGIFGTYTGLSSQIKKSQTALECLCKFQDGLNGEDRIARLPSLDGLKLEDFKENKLTPEKLEQMQNAAKNISEHNQKYGDIIKKLKELETHELNESLKLSDFLGLKSY